MKKVLLTLLCLSTFIGFSTNYYTCSANGKTSSLTRGGNCNVATDTTEVLEGDTLFITNGTTLKLTENFDVNGVIIIESGGVIDLFELDFLIKNGGVMLIRVGGLFKGDSPASKRVDVEGDGILIANGDMNFLNGYKLEVDGILIANSNIYFKDKIDIKGNGIVVGFGILDSDEVSGGGDVNGVEGDGAKGWGPEPVILADLGLRWEGSEWIANAGKLNTKDTKDILVWDRLFVDSVDFQSVENIAAYTFTVASGFKVRIGSGFFINTLSTITNDGLISFDCDATLFSETHNYAGSGTINISKCWPKPGYQHAGIPVNSSTTLTHADLKVNGTPVSLSGGTQNVFTWDAGNSAWVSPTGSLHNQPFLIYIPNVGDSLTIDMNMSDFNTNIHSFDVDYNDPGVNGSNSNVGWAGLEPNDGWNMYYNIYQSLIDCQKISSLMDQSVFASSAFYIWDGEQYEAFNNGVGSITTLAPEQAVFARVKPGGLRTTRLNGETRVPTKLLQPSTEKSIAKLTLDDGTKTVNLYVAEDAQSTSNYDSDFDAYAKFNNPDIPFFGSLTSDSVLAQINQIPSFRMKSVYLTIAPIRDNQIHSITLDKTQLSERVTIYLEDTHLQNFYDLTSYPTYNFISDTANNDPQRYKLHFSVDVTQVVENSEETFGLVYFSNDNLLWRPAQNKNVQSLKILDSMGKVVLESENLESNQIFTPLPIGVYVIQILTSDGSLFHSKLLKR